MSPITPEQREELMREFAANRARQEALTRKQRFEAGQFSIELDRADDDPDVNDPTFQAELSRFGASLRGASIPYGQTAIAFDAVDAHGYPLPEFIIAMAVLGPSVITPLAAAVGAWIQARYGRRARLKVGEVEAEARTVEEVEKLLKVAAKFQECDLDEGSGE